MTKLIIRWVACLIVVLFWWFIACQVFAADLPLPKPRPVVEQCMGPGITPAMKQVLATDPTCPGKLRWKNPK
jgi:hypothetical protein